MVFSTINSKGGNLKVRMMHSAFGAAFAEAEKNLWGPTEGDFTLRMYTNLNDLYMQHVFINIPHTNVHNMDDCLITRQIL